jgi:protocatechuate 3,4-dioxygenase beta subunit
MCSVGATLFGSIVRGARALLVACQPTADATRGPLHRRGAPWRTRLCPVDEPGQPLSISGAVTASGDCRPIEGATLDVWQTNARGLYSNLFGLENPSRSGSFNLRGRMKSDGQGHYRFHSVVPGRYPLFWPLTRPRHVHVMVTHPQYESLTTQIYFEGDEYNRSDPWWRESLTIRLQQHANSQSRPIEYHGVFDISLQPKADRRTRASNVIGDIC